MRFAVWCSLAVLRARTLYVLPCAVLIALAACSIDDRALSPEAGGGDGAGATAGFAGSGGGAGTSGSGGAAGADDTDAGDAGPMTPLLCNDTTVLTDCVSSLAANATFDSDTARWVQDPGSTQAWAAQDADHRSASGSLSVSNSMTDNKTGSVVAGSAQCLSIKGGDIFAISAEVFIAAGQAGSGVGGIYVSLFATTDCTESPLPYFGQSTLPSATDAWSNAHMIVDTRGTDLSTARSMSVRMIAQKPLTSPPFTVLFDNVLVEKRPAP